MCITESLCCTAELNTTLQINYTAIKKKKATRSQTRGWLQAQLEGYRTKPLPRQPLNELELGWGVEGYSASVDLPAPSTSCCFNNMGEKDHSASLCLHYSSQRTLQAQMSGHTVQTEGIHG